MAQVNVRVATSAGDLCYLQNHPSTAVRPLTVEAQGVMDIGPNQPCTVCVGNFGDKPVHLLKHTILGLALPSPAHILTIDPTAPRLATPKKRGADGNCEIPSTDSAKRWEV